MADHPAVPNAFTSVHTARGSGRSGRVVEAAAGLFPAEAGEVEDRGARVDGPFLGIDQPGQPGHRLAFGRGTIVPFAGVDLEAVEQPREDNRAAAARAADRLGCTSVSEPT